MATLPLRRGFADDVRLSSSDDLDRADQMLNLRLKHSYGTSLLVLFGLQLLVANALVAAYAGWGHHWVVPDGVMQTWLGATVVQLVAVVYVVVAHLFPRGGHG